MKVLSFIVLLFSFHTYAQNNVQEALTVNLGFNSSAVNLGAAYETKYKGNMGFSGFFFFSGEEEDAGEPEYKIIGLHPTIHFYQSNWDFYIGPGLAISIVDDAGDDETTLGALIKLGAVYKMNKKYSLGIENIKAYNWFSDELPSGPIDVTTLGLRIHF